VTNGKNRKPIIDDAQTSTADVPVAPSVPRGTAIDGGSEDREDERAADGHRTVPSTASTACTEATVSPAEIAKQITSLLNDKGIPQRLFAEKVLNRSQGSFSDYLSKAPTEMPKTHSRAIWSKLKEFLESEEQQQELMEMKTSKYCLMPLLLCHKQKYNLAKRSFVGLLTGETSYFFLLFSSRKNSKKP